MSKKLQPEQFTLSDALSIAVVSWTKAYDADLSWEEWEKIEKAEKLERDRRRPRGDHRPLE